MAFSFGNLAGNAGFGGAVSSSAQSETGPDLEEIQTSGIGFLSLAGESKIQLLPLPWPSDALPPPTSSLLSVASTKGLLAAGGPDGMVIASTESVREGFLSSGSSDNNVKPFTPQLNIPLGMRVSQVAFSADENYLTISAENGGGLAVYEVQSLMQGNTQPSFELSTNRVPVRGLIPNPTAEKAELFAVVTTSGDLMMANLKTRQFISGPNAQVLKRGVSCVSWSNKGKQLVAGLGNGTGCQLTPEGQEKAEIPRPQGLDGDQHGTFTRQDISSWKKLMIPVSSISWLENHLFLMVHTPTSFDSDTVPSSTFHLVTRQPPSSYGFQKLPDPCPPFGLNRSPPYQFLLRLRDFPPNLQDLLVVSSTGSIDIGLFTRSKAPLTSDLPSEKVTNVFTTTGMADDSRRATLSMTEDMNDTSPIGVAFDLSSKEKVDRPIPSEEMDDSPTPLPGLMVLNNEGILAAWWIVYSDSIRQNVGYPGLTAVGGSQQQQPKPPSLQQNVGQAPPFASSTGPQQPAFGQSAFSNSSPSAGTFGGSFAKPAVPAFGTTSAPGASSTGAFGAPSGFGSRSSPWGGSSGSTVVPKSGAAAFGSTTPIGGASQGASFGAAGGMGIRPSPWGTPASSLASPTAGSTFGQASTPGAKTTSSLGGAPAGSFGNSNSNTAFSPSGFGEYAKSGGFAAAAAQGGAGSGSIFSKGDGGSFGVMPDTSFGGTSANKSEQASGGLLVTGGSSGFNLGSTFKGDGSAKDDVSKSPTEAGSSFFGSGFGNALGDAQKPAFTPEMKEADMDTESSGDEAEQKTRPPDTEEKSTTPASTPASAKSQFPGTGPPAKSGLFGTQAQSKITPAAVQSSEPVAPTAVPRFQFSGTDPPTTGGLFGTQAQNKTMPAAVQSSKPVTWSFRNDSPQSAFQAQNSQGEAPHSPAPLPPSPKVKPEPADVGVDSTSQGVDKNIPEPPLPPDPTSKSSYAPGDSSASSTAASKDSSEEAPLPPDFLPSKESRADAKPEEQPAIPSEEEDEGLGGEGSGEDVAQDISPTTDPNQSPKITPGSSFGASFDRSPVGGLFTNIPRQPPQQPPTRSLFGEIGNKSAPIFPLTSQLQQSPRSPSPVRNAIPPNLPRPDNSRSISAPGVRSQSTGPRKSLMSPPTPRTSQSRPAPTAEDQRKLERERLLGALKMKQAEEDQDLSDKEDEKVREDLAAEVQGTLTLEPFIAHQDYIGHINKPGIPGQIEKVYRDINSMIDTLGINARSLKAFVQGHSEMFKDGGRSREDLEDKEDWCLIEIDDLSIVENSLAKQLDDGGVEDVQGKLRACQELQKDLAKLRAKHNDIKKTIDAHNDPDLQDSLRSAPLSAEQAMVQHDLRKDFTNFQSLLSEAEEGITLLKAKLASSQGGNDKAGGRQTPTVEAVMKTIMKMTSMAEKKSGDIDVLENQMRRLRFNSMTSATGSREGSPFATPPSSKSRGQGTLGSTYAFYTPDSTQGTPRAGLGASLGSSLNGGTPRKKMSGVTPEDVQGYNTKMARRKEVCNRLRESIKKAGPRIRAVDDA
ncbi:MAG: hypothetical protein M1827_006326 [Pycnora praestabilis]|nr:MAG: hypothetical protein M1827_006326 [Pycnora praestabilis]